MTFQIFQRNILADIRIHHKFDTFIHHQLQPAVYYTLSQLEVRNAVTQKSAYFCRLLVNCNHIPHAVESGCRGKTCRTSPYYRNLFAIA